MSDSQVPSVEKNADEKPAHLTRKPLVKQRGDRKVLRNRMPSNVAFVREAIFFPRCVCASPGDDAVSRDCRFLLRIDKKGGKKGKVGLTPPRPSGPRGGSPRYASHLPPFVPLPASAAAAPALHPACSARPARPPRGSPHPRRPAGPRRWDR